MIKIIKIKARVGQKNETENRGFILHKYIMKIR